MTKPFPSKEEVEFYLENKEFWQELWEPAFGDLVLRWHGDKAEWDKDLWLVIGRYGEDAIDVFRERDGAIGAALIFECLPLFHIDQLIEMLEKRRYECQLVTMPRRSLVNVWDRDLGGYFAKGSTSTIALAKALMEVIEKEEKDEI